MMTKKLPAELFELFNEQGPDGFGELTWQERAADKARRRLLRLQNAQQPERPRCACCQGVVRGDRVKNGGVILDPEAVKFLGCCEPGDVLCFWCWADIEPNIGERYHWGRC